jgi:hypothetical protein
MLYVQHSKVTCPVCLERKMKQVDRVKRARAIIAKRKLKGPTA